jgi:hypothetical protein
MSQERIFPKNASNQIKYIAHRKIAEKINWNYFDTMLSAIKDILERDKINVRNLSIVICPIYSNQAETFMVKEDEGQSIIFDCFLGAILKQFYQHLITGSSQEQMFPFFKDFVATLVLSKKQDALALALRDEKISKLYYRTHDDRDFITEKARIFFDSMPKTSFHDLVVYIDFFVVAHEIFHSLEESHPGDFIRYLSLAGLIYNRMAEMFSEEGIEWYIDTILADFEARKVNITDKDKVRQEYRKIKLQEKALFESKKSQLIEEIAADIFAFKMTNSAIHGSHKLQFDEVFTISYIISLLLYMIDFLKERSSAFETTSSLWHKQDSSSLLLLRNAALMEYVIENLAEFSFRPKHIKQFSLTEELILDLTAIRKKLNDVKKYFDYYILEQFNFPLQYTLSAARTKVDNPEVGQVYKDAANDWDISTKIWYVSPTVEDYTTDHYFLHR